MNSAENIYSLAEVSNYSSVSRRWRYQVRLHSRKYPSNTSTVRDEQVTVKQSAENGRVELL